MASAVWLFGVAINLVGSILINLGTNVMKLGHNKRAAMLEPLSGSKIPVRKIREWQLGVALFSIGNVANFISFGYAAQSLLAAIGCVQFVSNVLFASFVLKEHVSAAVIVAISCIVGGCILLVSFGSHVSHEYTYRDLLALYGEPAYISYLVVGTAVVMAACAAFWFGQRQVVTKGAHAARVWAALLPVLYCLFSAIIGTQSVLFSKTLAVLLRATFNGDNQLSKWFTWIVLAAFLFTAVYWVSRLNKGLKMFPAMVIVPTLQICWTLFSIVSGMLYFQEYQGMHALHAWMFALGVAIVFTGVYVLTKASVPAPSPPDDHFIAELTKAKIAYVHNSCLDTHDGMGDSTISSAGKDKKQEQHSPEGALVSDMTGSREDSFLFGSTSHPDLTLQFEDDNDEFSGVSDNQSLLGSNKVASGPSVSRSRGFSFTSALTSLRLQNIWPGGAEKGRLSSPSGPMSGNSTGSGSRRPASEGGAGVSLDHAGPGHEQGSMEEYGSQRWPVSQGLSVNIRSLSRHVAADFSLDETAAAKLSLGLGDSSMPGISLFTMPMADLNGGSPARVTRRYGMLSDSSHRGGQEAGILQPHHYGGSASRLQSSCVSNRSSVEYDDGSLRPGAAAAIRSLNKGASGSRKQMEQELAQLGGAQSINPLANAISINPSLQTNKAPADGLMNNVEEAAKHIKHNIQEIKSSVKELRASIQTAVGRGPKSYERMQSEDDMPAIAQEVDEHEALPAAS